MVFNPRTLDWASTKRAAEMIICNFAQGSDEWVEARLGIPTASEFSKIVTSTGNCSSQLAAYKRQLIREWILGEPTGDFQGTYWTDRGNECEPEARAYYEYETDQEVIQCGFIYADDSKMWGASPDGLVGNDGLLELKTPSMDWHAAYCLEPELPTKYRIQVQGQMWVTGREWCDFVSYYPEYPVMRVRVERDEKLHAAFDEHIIGFVAELKAGRSRLLELGFAPYGS